MTREDARQLIEQSLARPSATPNTSTADRETFLEREKAKLRECLIDPIPVTAVASDWAQRYANQDDAVRTMHALACSSDNWLLYDESTKEFSLAFGKSLSDQPFRLLGFSSDDALAEWRG